MSDLTRQAIAADPVRAMTGDEIRALIEENEQLKAERSKSAAAYEYAMKEIERLKAENADLRQEQADMCRCERCGRQWLGDNPDFNDCPFCQVFERTLQHKIQLDNANRKRVECEEKESEIQRIYENQKQQQVEIELLKAELRAEQFSHARTSKQMGQWRDSDRKQIDRLEEERDQLRKRKVDQGVER